MIDNQISMQAAYDALCAEIKAAGARKEKRDQQIEHIQKCFCFACKTFIDQLKPSSNNCGVKEPVCSDTQPSKPQNT